MTDTKTELTFADEVADMAAEALRGYQIAESDLIDAGSEVLQAAGPALVAAELRRLADEMDEGCARYVQDGASPTKVFQAEQQIIDARALRSRADELDRSGR